MKKLMLAAMMLLVCSSLAWAEASFDQIQGLIKVHDYAAAVQGLNLIVQNHPNSAKAWYAMSQAQAGIGNQAKAQEALDRATGLDPKLKFASSGDVKALKEAVQPQTSKIRAVESHALRNWMLFFLVIGGVAFVSYRIFRKKEEEPPSRELAYPKSEPPRNPSPSSHEIAARASLAANPLYRDRPVFRTVPPYIPPPQPVHHTTVVNHGGSGDLATGIMLGHMMSSGNTHERVVEREYVREVPRDEPRHSSSWEDSSSSSSSSWDSGSSSSSTWDSGSSSSSWDSSSDSSSSSSWD